MSLKKKSAVKENQQTQLDNIESLTPEQLAFLQEYEGKGPNGSKKAAKKAARVSKRKEKISMYDMIVANLIAGNAIIEPTTRLDNSQIAIGFSNIASAEQLTKYFMINKFPDFLQPRLIDVIRSKCMTPGIKINFYFYASSISKWNTQKEK